MSLLALALSITLIAADAPESIESTVRERVREFAAAFRDGDVETIENLLGAEYSHCNSDGSRPSRDQWLSWYASRAAEIRDGRFAFDEYRNEDIQIQIHDQVVVVTAVNISSGTRDGTLFSHRLRFTQVWIIEDGSWKRIAFHDSRVQGS